MVVGGVEEAAALRVPELLEQDLGELLRRGNPARLERRLVERDQRVDEISIVFQVAVQPRLIRAGQTGTVKPALGGAHPLQQVVGGRHSLLDEIAVVEHLARAGEGADHQRVPRR